jgi:hypothetical protein
LRVYRSLAVGHGSLFPGLPKLLMRPGRHTF